MNKRDFIKTSLIGFAGITLAPGVARSITSKTAINPQFSLPRLSFDFDTLEPFISKENLKNHYQVIHAGYTNKLNEGITRYNVKSNILIQILKKISWYPSLQKYAGGHLNHRMFWNTINPHSKGKPSERLNEMIISDFDSLDNFKNEFQNIAHNNRKEGWCWLILKNNHLKIVFTHDEDNPYMNTIPASKQGYPVLALDLHEHAYSEDFSSKKAYIEAFWSIVNWNFINKKINKGIRNHRS